METAGVFAIGGSGGARTIVSLDSNEDGGILWPEQQLPQRPFFQIAPDADGWDTHVVVDTSNAVSVRTSS